MSTVKSKKIQLGVSDTSTDNFTIYQPSTPDGTLRIGQGNADSPTEVGQFNANGYKPADPIAFFAYQTTGLSISNNTTTTVTWDGTEYNYGSTFTASTNRFTAPYDGIYTLVAGVGMNSLSDGDRIGTRFMINGSTSNDNTQWHLVGAAASTCNPVVTMIRKLDADDYVHIQFFHDNGTTRSTNPNKSVTFFQGTLTHLL